MSEQLGKSIRLAIAGASARAAACSAVRGGYETTAFDHFADADLAAVCPVTRFDSYGEPLAEDIRAAEADAWIYVGGVENQTEWITRMSAVAPLWGCGPDVLRKVRDPQWLASTLRRGGYAYPTIQTQRPASDHQAWLVKRLRSGGGLGIRRLAEVGNDEHQQGGGYYQQRLEGRPISGMFLADAVQCQLLSVFEQWIGLPWTGAAEEFLYCGGFGPLPLADAVQQQLRGIGELLHARSGLLGLFGIDCLLRDDRVTLLEVNPRYTASMELWERASGQSAVDLHCRACRGLPWEIRPVAATESYAKAIVYAEQPLTVGEPFQRLVSQVNQGAWPTVADLPHAGQQIGRGEPVCTVFARGEDREALVHDLRSRVNAIRWSTD